MARARGSLTWNAAHRRAPVLDDFGGHASGPDGTQGDRPYDSAAVMLTDRQIQIIRSTREWIAEYGEAPSVRELAAAVGVSFTSSIVYQLRRLREVGIQIETRGRPRGRCPHCGH